MGYLLSIVILIASLLMFGPFGLVVWIAVCLSISAMVNANR